MALGMYIITGFAVLVGTAALVLSWKLVKFFSTEKAPPVERDQS